jgi:iron complex outermembrane receptor protein
LALLHNLRLTSGIKLERNNYTGLEVLPSLRLAWKLSPDQLAWSAVSRAVRAPSRIDRDFYSPTNPPMVGGAPHYTFAGGPDFESEIANVAEIGYRAQPTATLSYSATVFYSKYDHLRTAQPDSTGSIVFLNGGEAHTHGIESWANWQAAARWRLSGGVVAQKIDTSVKPGFKNVLSTTGLATSDPRNHWMLRSSHDVTDGQELDFTVRHSSSLESPHVPAYTTLDLHYGWRLRPGLDFSVTGQNLAGPAHREYGGPGATVFDRTVYLKLLWRH